MTPKYYLHYLPEYLQLTIWIYQTSQEDVDSNLV